MKSLKKLKLKEDRFHIHATYHTGKSREKKIYQIDAPNEREAQRQIPNRHKHTVHWIANANDPKGQAVLKRQKEATYSTDKNPQYEPYKPKYALSTKDRHEIQHKRLAAGEKFTFKESKLEQSFPAVAEYFKLKSFKQAHDDRMKKIKGMVDAHAQNKPIGRVAKKISGGNSDHSRAYDRIAGTRPFKMPGV